MYIFYLNHFSLVLFFFLQISIFFSEWRRWAVYFTLISSLVYLNKNFINHEHLTHKCKRKWFSERKKTWMQTSWITGLQGWACPLVTLGFTYLQQTKKKNIMNHNTNPLFHNWIKNGYCSEIPWGIVGFFFHLKIAASLSSHFVGSCGLPCFGLFIGSSINYNKGKKTLCCFLYMSVSL